MCGYAGRRRGCPRAPAAARAPRRRTRDDGLADHLGLAAQAEAALHGDLDEVVEEADEAAARRSGRAPAAPRPSAGQGDQLGGEVPDQGREDDDRRRPWWACRAWCGGVVGSVVADLLAVAQLRNSRIATRVPSSETISARPPPSRIALIALFLLARRAGAAFASGGRLVRARPAASAHTSDGRPASQPRDGLDQDDVAGAQAASQPVDAASVAHDVRRPAADLLDPEPTARGRVADHEQHVDARARRRAARSHVRSSAPSPSSSIPPSTATAAARAGHVGQRLERRRGSSRDWRCRRR